MGFSLTSSRIYGQTKYIAYLSDFLEGGNDPIQAGFIFDDGQAVRMGLELETALEGIDLVREDEGELNGLGIISICFYL